MAAFKGEGEDFWAAATELWLQTLLHVAALRFGSATGLSLALLTCVGWNLALWWNGRRKLVR